MTCLLGAAWPTGVTNLKSQRQLPKASFVPTRWTSGLLNTNNILPDHRQRLVREASAFQAKAVT